MATNINPNNINGAYPVAGQDNDSQGFRDNFTNIKTNFVYAAAEISDLQSKAVLKAALTGSELSNDMGGTIISDVALLKPAELRSELNSVSGDVTLNYAQASVYALTTGGNVTITPTGFPPAGRSGELLLQVSANAAHSLTFANAVGNGAAVTGAAYIAGFDNSTKTLTFPAAGTYRYALSSNDGGATVFIRDLTQPLINATTSGNITAGNVITNSVTASGNITAGNVITDNIIGNITGNIIALTGDGSIDITGNITTTGNITAGNVITDNIVGNITGDITALTGNGSIDITGNITTTGTVTGNIIVGNSVVSQEFVTVTVGDDGSGTQAVFFFDGTALKTNVGVLTDFNFDVNTRYKFDISDISNEDANLHFSTTPDTAVPASITPYTTNVTRSGNAGTSGAYVEILITEDTPSPLYFYGTEEVGNTDTSLHGGAVPFGITQLSGCQGFDTMSANGNIALKTSATVITVSSDFVANLASGANCQTKVIAYGNSSTGNAIITVEDAIWGNTVTLANTGSAVTLQWLNSKWFATGANDVTFG